MTRFLVPITGEMQIDGYIHTFWAVSYEERLLGSMISLHFFNNSGGCDGKILDWLYADAPDFMRDVIQKKKKEIKSWYKPRKRKKARCKK